MSSTSTSTEARTTIYVGTDLRDRLASAGAAINCSAVCRRALERELAHLESRRKSRNLRDVLARLRSEALLERDETYRRAFEDGIAWAEQDASYTNLHELHVANEKRLGVDWTVRGILGVLMEPADLANPKAFAQQADEWRKRYGQGNADRAVGAFVRGANSVFEQIRDLV